MGSIANLFDRHIRKFDAKKCIFYLIFLNWVTPYSPALYQRGGGGRGEWVFKVFDKKEGSDFFYKNGVFGKIGRVIYKKGGITIFILSNPFQCYPFFLSV